MKERCTDWYLEQHFLCFPRSTGFGQFGHSVLSEGPGAWFVSLERGRSAWDTCMWQYLSPTPPAKKQSTCSKFAIDQRLLHGLATQLARECFMPTNRSTTAHPPTHTHTHPHTRTGASKTTVIRGQDLPRLWAPVAAPHEVSSAHGAAPGPNGEDSWKTRNLMESEGTLSLSLSVCVCVCQTQTC